MILDDGGDATHLILKKYPAMFKMIKGQINLMNLVFKKYSQTLNIHARYRWRERDWSPSALSVIQDKQIDRAGHECQWFRHEN